MLHGISEWQRGSLKDWQADSMFVSNDVKSFACASFWAAVLPITQVCRHKTKQVSIPSFNWRSGDMLSDFYTRDHHLTCLSCRSWWWWRWWFSWRWLCCWFWCSVCKRDNGFCFDVKMEYKKMLSYALRLDAIGITRSSIVLSREFFKSGSLCFSEGLSLGYPS